MIAARKIRSRPARDEVLWRMLRGCPCWSGDFSWGSFSPMLLAVCTKGENYLISETWNCNALMYHQLVACLISTSTSSSPRMAVHIAKAEASTMSRKYVRHLVYVEVALLVSVSAAAIIAWSWRVSTLLRL